MAEEVQLTVKYLSSPKLLRLQLQDAALRRHFLVQVLPLMALLLSTWHTLNAQLHSLPRWPPALMPGSVAALHSCPLSRVTRHRITCTQSHPSTDPRGHLLKGLQPLMLGSWVLE